MALFSFRHSVKTFSAKRDRIAREAKQGQTAAHLRYIARPKAARVVLRTRVEATDRHTAKIAEDTAHKRKGRVAERFIIALPVEATPGQREALASAFANKITDDKAGFILAIHDKAGNDRNNPHMHLVAFDAFEKTGGRGRPRSVIGMARKGAVERTAAMWAAIHNEMMTGWGYREASMISHLSNEAQGIERIPTIHEGPTARKMASDGKKPKCKTEWRKIDGGHSRPEANRLIREINTLKEQEANARRTHRLGGNVEGDKPAGQASSPKQRTHTGRSSRNAAQSIEPNRHPLSPDEDPKRTARPPFLNKHGTTNNEDNRPPWERIAPATLANRPPVIRRRRRRRVARLWHELKILRDTLGARLANSRRRAPKAVWDFVEEASRPETERGKHQVK